MVQCIVLMNGVLNGVLLVRNFKRVQIYLFVLVSANPVFITPLDPNCISTVLPT